MHGISTLPESGDTLAGKYRIDTVLGRGGTSIVYSATHLITGRRFAIKLLRPEVSSQPDAARRFVRESQVSGRVQHPNVIEIFDIGEDRGSHYMVMEWLDGESLAERIERAVRVSLDETRSLLLPCMHAVAAAHAAGIVHRDLKPANVFICRAGSARGEHVKVLDFGISKLTADLAISSTLTSTGVVLGTPYYMAPEQMHGEPADARADIYAFGVILYQMLAGRLPYPAKTYGELVLQIARGAPPPLEQLAPWLPRAMIDVVARAMAREPSARFRAMGELIAALERVGLRQSDEDDASRHVSETHLRPRSLRWTTAFSRSSNGAGRRPWLFGIAALLLLAGGLGLYRSRASEPGRASSARSAHTPPAEPVPHPAVGMDGDEAAAPAADSAPSTNATPTAQSALPTGVDVPQLADDVPAGPPLQQAPRRRAAVVARPKPTPAPAARDAIPAPPQPPSAVSEPTDPTEPRNRLRMDIQ